MSTAQIEEFREYVCYVTKIVTTTAVRYIHMWTLLVQAFTITASIKYVNQKEEEEEEHEEAHEEEHRKKTEVTQIAWFFFQRMALLGRCFSWTTNH